MFGSTFALSFTALLAFVASVTAWTPKFTSPSKGDTWSAGSRQTVTWDVTAMPTSSDGLGLLMFGYYDQDNNRILDMRNPLATDFLFSAGSVEVTVPGTATHTDAIVVLTGGEQDGVSAHFSTV